MKTCDVFPSQWIAAEDLPKDLTVTIESVTLEELKTPEGKQQRKPVARFKGQQKAMILNKTNWHLIARQHGDESDEWAGKSVTLTTVSVTAFGETWRVVRVKPNAEHGTRTAEPAKGRDGAPGKAPAARVPWRDVVIPFGKMKDKRLGDCTPDQLAWWQKEWQPKPFNGRVTPEAEQLRHALDESMTTDTGELPLPAGDEDVPF